MATDIQAEANIESCRSRAAQGLCYAEKYGARDLRGASPLPIAGVPP